MSKQNSKIHSYDNSNHDSNNHDSNPNNLNPFALAGIICGIAGVILGWVIPFLGITLGVFGIVLSRFTAKDVSRWLANTGLILGILGILSGVSRVLAIYIVLIQVGLL